MRNGMFLKIYEDTAARSRLGLTAEYIQHGNTSCLLHSIAVAYYCYRLSVRFGFLKLNKRELIRGALLHDYFLYDWHIPDKNRPLHGFYHPTAALKESYVVFLVDNVCSVYEIFKKSPYKNPQIRCALKRRQDLNGPPYAR